MQQFATGEPLPVKGNTRMLFREFPEDSEIGKSSGGMKPNSYNDIEMNINFSAVFPELWGEENLCAQSPEEVQEKIIRNFYAT